MRMPRDEEELEEDSSEEESEDSSEEDEDAEEDREEETDEEREEENEEEEQEEEVAEARDAREAPPERSFFPKDLGPWVMTAAPLVAALGSGKLNISGVSMGVFAICYLFAYPPALVALGYRGEEHRREDGWRARRRILALVMIALAAATLAFFFGNQRFRLSLLGPMAFAALTGVLTVRHEEKSFWGQLVTGVTLSGLTFPICIAMPLPPYYAAQFWIAWILGFTGAMVAMRCIFEKANRKETHTRAVVWLSLLSVLGGIGYVRDVTPGFVPALPLLLASWIVVLWHPHPRKGKVVNGLLAGGAFLTCAALIFLTRY